MNDYNPFFILTRFNKAVLIYSGFVYVKLFA